MKEKNNKKVSEKSKAVKVVKEDETAALDSSACAVYVFVRGVSPLPCMEVNSPFP